MSLGIIHLLEMVQIDKNERKLVVVPLRPVNLGLQDESHMPRVIQRRAIIGNRKFVNALHVSRILQRNRRKVRKRFQ